MQFRSLLEPRSQTRSERHAFATERVRIGEEGLEQQIPREIISTIERKKTWNRETSREINYLYARRTTTISAMMDRNFAPRLCSKSHHIFSSSRIIKGLNNSIDRNDGKRGPSLFHALKKQCAARCCCTERVVEY